jgi:hypothetical protein
VKIVGSKILFRKPSEKAIELSAGFQVEVVEVMLEKFNYLTNDMHIELHPELEDSQALLEYFQDAFDVEDFVKLSGDDFGQGIALGFIMGHFAAAQQELDEE